MDDYNHLYYRCLPQIINILFKHRNLETIAAIRLVSRHSNEIYRSQTSIVNHVDILAKVLASLSRSHSDKTFDDVWINKRQYNFYITKPDETKQYQYCCIEDSHIESLRKPLQCYIDIEAKDSLYIGFSYEELKNLANILLPLEALIRRRFRLVREAQRTLNCASNCNK